MGNLKLEENKKRKKVKKEKKTGAELFQKEVNKEEEENEKIKPIEKKKRKRDKGNNADTGKSIQPIKEVKEEEEESEKIKPIRKTKKKREKGNNVDNGKVVQLVKEKNIEAEGKKIKNKASKKKRKHDEKNNSLVSKSNQLDTEDEGGLDKQNDDGAEDKSPSENQANIDDLKLKFEAIDGTETRASKSKKSKKRKKESDASQKSENLLKKKEVIEDEVQCISSGEEDCSKGMKKWLTEYHQSRPGLKVLQQRIDDFINTHDEKLEQEKKEREAEASKDGWTVVVHHKGRKKTTDSESGITVGSVAPAVAESLGTAKKHKEVNLDFYRFQKRESQRNEILALQSKFEQDRKRIQQLRAARKFRPY
ncbi:uncharacterized protein [Euphorbia lathyris]|uniref:uncharacterized protein n=1 Tax=Euphorbia lathyris TaxID=212925 RepID=UPI0033138A12